MPFTPDHLSLIEAAKAETDFVVVTVFVNPMQFGPNEDLARYPRPLEDDLAACRSAGVDLVFHPEVDVVYPRENATFVEVPMSLRPPGRIRPSGTLSWRDDGGAQAFEYGPPGRCVFSAGRTISNSY